MRVVRLCTRKHPNLDGKGAALTGGRWNSAGREMVYTSSCGALAVLEYMAHMSRLPRDMVLLLIEIPDTLQIEQTEWAPADAVASQRLVMSG
jgi:RES domain-containing protein